MARPKRQPTLEGLDDLKAEQALAKRAMERHLAGETALIDEGPAQGAVDFRTELLRNMPPAWIDQVIAEQARRELLQLRSRSWWYGGARPDDVMPRHEPCGSRIRHSLIRFLELRHQVEYDAGRLIEDTDVGYERVEIDCPCVVRIPHATRLACRCVHGHEILFP